MIGLTQDGGSIVGMNKSEAKLHQIYQAGSTSHKNTKQIKTLELCHRCKKQNKLAVAFCSLWHLSAPDNLADCKLKQEELILDKVNYAK